MNIFTRIGRKYYELRPLFIAAHKNRTFSDEMGTFGFVRQFLTVLIMFLSSFFGSIFVLFPILPLFFVWPKMWRTLNDLIIGAWELLPVALIELLCNVEISVRGDPVRYTDKAIIIMNHRTRLDWLFFWNALCRMDPWLLTSLKISLKSSVKKIPGAGWAMQCNSFMFLQRVWNKDESLMRDVCRYLAIEGNPYQVLIFPEGTDYCMKSKARSDAYCIEKGLEIPHYVLQPRITGLACVIDEMMKSNSLDYVYDVTIGYPAGLVQTEIDFAIGRGCPSRVCFEVKRIAVAKADFSTQESVTAWCRELWRKKDKVLERFFAEENPAERKFDSHHVLFNVDNHSVMLWFWLFHWLFWIFAWCYMLYAYFWARVYFFVGLLTFFVIGHVYGGIEMLVIEHSRSRFRRSD